MTQLITIHGVRGYIDSSGTAHLNLEDVSHGLGFTQCKNGVDYIRWERVNGHLVESGFSPLVGKEFIPENVFYRLAMRADNDKGRDFQAKVADEILPSIRKTGSYNVKQIQTPQTLTEALRLALELSEKNERISAENKELSLITSKQQQKLKEQEAPVAIYNLAISAQNTMSMQEVAKSLGTGRTKLYQILREEEVIMKNSTLPYQRYIDAGYFKVTERPRASGDAIVNDPATRVYAKGFDYIARLLKRRAERLAKRLEMDA